MGTSLLSPHLDQIAQCATSIGELEFVEPKMFTNAMLARHDITALIRDTEIHERALFSIAPPPIAARSDLGASFASSTSTHARGSHTPHAIRQPKRNTAVAAVLGRDLYRRVRDANSNASNRPARAKSEVDVELLLEGAARLCEVYPLPGATDEIAKLRARYEQLSANIAHYEDRTARNAQQLEGLYQRQGWEADDVDVDLDAGNTGLTVMATAAMNKEELAREEKEIQELERKKKGLEHRVNEMEKDLGGLMR